LYSAAHPPPPPPLFPYTTLFRSTVLAHDVERAWLLLLDAGRPLRVFGREGLEAWLRVLPLYAELQLGEAARAAEHLAAGVPDQRDRKSTRLNSSHVASSYAVLCL